jgi:glutathione S-transferase
MCRRLALSKRMGETMGKLKIYGTPRSRASRVLWLADELGLDYENIPVQFADGGTRKPEYLAINPNAKIPAIDDDGLVLFESMAILLHLAKKHDKGLWPKTAADEARTLQWTFWAMTEAEMPIVTALQNRVILPEERRDAALADAAEKQAMPPLRVLDQALATSRYLLGDSFTIADLTVAAVVGAARRARIDLDVLPHLSRWLDACVERPAATAVAPYRRG